MVILAVASPGCSCGGDETTPPGNTAGAGGAGGEGGGASTSTSTGGGAGGEGGAVATEGVQATEMVSAGEVCSSPGYRMVFTFGQSTQNQGSTTSPSYRLQGGLVGANGSPP